MDRTSGALDRAVIAYREDPTEANRLRLLAAQAAHTEAFYREQSDEFIERTR
jgi:hypothetical protein